jgi:hypothetical protein
MSSENKTSSSSVGFGGLLTLIFIVLKLTHYIDWDWIWVLSPLWIPVLLILAIFVIFLIIAWVVEAGKLN